MKTGLGGKDWVLEAGGWVIEEEVWGLEEKGEGAASVTLSWSGGRSADEQGKKLGNIC